MSSRFFTLILSLLLAGCDGSGRLSAPDAAGDDVLRGDAAAGDGAPAGGPAVDAPPRTPGPTISEVVPLPLVDYGPAFRMEVEDRGDGLLGVVVRARSLTSFVGFAAQIAWDAELLELVEAEATAPLGGPDAVARGVAAGLGPGRLTLGAVRFPNAVDPWHPQPAGMDLPGEVEMGRFVLRPLTPGDAVIRFTEGRRVARRPDYSEIP